nr:MAG TPA: hypothetical protein [Caudoviricetes sp.]
MIINLTGTLRGAFLMPIFIQRAQHQHIHTLGMDSLYVSVCTSFRHGGNRPSLWCWQDCILVNIKNEMNERW